MEKTHQARKATVSCTSCGKLNRVDLTRVQDRPKCASCGALIALDRPLPVSDQTFDRVIGDTEVPVIVDFYADWCGPCKMMAPIFDDLARRRVGEVLFAKLDTDRNPMVASRFGIRGIPTLIVFRGGREVARQTGALPKPQLETVVESALRGAPA